MISRNDAKKARHREYMRDVWYPKNKERQKKLVRENRKRFKAEVDALKDKPCKDCGIKYPPGVMEFDHVRGNKIMEISKMIRNKGRLILMKEISKCDLVCANCHRLRTIARSKSQ